MMSSYTFTVTMHLPQTSFESASAVATPKPAVQGSTTHLHIVARDKDGRILAERDA